MRVKMRSVEREARLLGGDERTNLGEQNNQGRLAKVSGFAAHVGSGDEQDLMSGAVEEKRVGDEALALLLEELLDNGMAATENG